MPSRESSRPQGEAHSRRSCVGVERLPPRGWNQIDARCPVSEIRTGIGVGPAEPIPLSIGQRIPNGAPVLGTTVGRFAPTLAEIRGVPVVGAVGLDHRLRRVPFAAPAHFLLLFFTSFAGPT